MVIFWETCIAAAIWIIFVRYVAELSRFAWPPCSWSWDQTPLVALEVSSTVLVNDSQSAFFLFHLSVVEGMTWSSLSAVISNLMNSWSDPEALSSSIAQLEMRTVTGGDEKARSRTDDPLLKWWVGVSFSLIRS